MPRLTPRRRAVGALTVALVAVSAAACSSAEPESADSPAPATNSSAGSAGESESSAPSSPSSSPTGGTEASEGRAVKVQKFADRLLQGIERTKYAHLEFTMSGAGGEMKGSGDVDYTATPANISMTMEIGPQTLGMLLVDKAMYVQSSQAGEKYIRYDLGDPSNPLGSNLADQLDPASSMESFAKQVKSVRFLGKEDLDGRRLSHYEMTVDTTKLPDPSTPGLPPELVVGVWLDDLDRMARTVMLLGAVQYDATLSDLDKKVSIKEPPADQVVTPPGS